MTKTRKIIAWIPLAFLLLLSACNPGWNDFDFRIVWKPDSTVCGSDSCLQRFYMNGSMLTERIWCTPEAEAYMQAENDIQVILARHEWRGLKEQALRIRPDSSAKVGNLSTLLQGEAIIWITQDHKRNGLLVHVPGNPEADSLISQTRKILLTRRPEK